MHDHLFLALFVLDLGKETVHKWPWTSENPPSEKFKFTLKSIINSHDRRRAFITPRVSNGGKTDKKFLKPESISCYFQSVLSWSGCTPQVVSARFHCIKNKSVERININKWHGVQNYINQVKKSHISSSLSFRSLIL